METIKDIDELRLEINDIDEKMRELFIKRMKVVEGIARYKESIGMEVLDSSREKEVVTKNSSKVEDETLKKHYIKYLESNMKISREFQKELLGLKNKEKIGYQGIEGSFSSIALKNKYKEIDFLKDTKSYQNFEDVFSGIVNKEIDKGILPIENSLTGDITDNFDLIKKYNLYITDIIKIKIDHNLLGVKGAKLEDIKEVYSHIQGFKQSKKFLKNRNFKEIPYYNTAISAKYVSELNHKTKGAIGSIELSKIYNLDVLAKEINTEETNATKFIEVSNKLEVEPHHNRAMVVFSTFNKSGDLSNVLAEFRRYDINMLSIKSRPLKEASWEYMFFVELEGNYKVIKTSLDKIKEKTKYFEVIGSYEN